MKKEYYKLPTDSYGQPDGTIQKVMLTKKEYKKAKESGEYIYEDYMTAHYRAID